MANELTKSSMHKLVQLMVASTNLGPNSRFLEVYKRWLLSICCLKACLKTAAVDAASAATSDRYGPADPSGGGQGGRTTAATALETGVKAIPCSYKVIFPRPVRLIPLRMCICLVLAFHRICG